MAYLLSENMVNTVALYLILKKIMQPFDSWDAFKLGIIDKDGKKLKEPKTSKELAAWDLLTKFVWNFKKTIGKFVGKSKLANYFATAWLLKDSLSVFYIEQNRQKLDETLLSDMTFAKQSLLAAIIKELPENHIKVTEENFEYLMHLYVPKIDKILIDKETLIC
jgi:hypothetical protein